MSTKISSANATRVCFFVIYYIECVYLAIYRALCTGRSESLSRFHLHSVRIEPIYGFANGKKTRTHIIALAVRCCRLEMLVLDSTAIKFHGKCIVRLFSSLAPFMPESFEISAKCVKRLHTALLLLYTEITQIERPKSPYTKVLGFGIRMEPT